MDKALKFFDDRATKVVESGKHTQYVDFFRRIAAEFSRNKEMDIPTFQKLSKESGLVPQPENYSETTYKATDRVVDANRSEKAGKLRMSGIISDIVSSGNKTREIIGVIESSSMGDDQLFALTESNGK